MQKSFDFRKFVLSRVGVMACVILGVYVITFFVYYFVTPGPGEREQAVRDLARSQQMSEQQKE